MIQDKIIISKSSIDYTLFDLTYILLLKKYIYNTN